MSVLEMDGDRISFDPTDLVDFLSHEAKERLALTLACDTQLMLHVAKLMADGITFDDQSRWWYPPCDEMQTARLYLLEHFDELQAEAVKEAESQRDAAKRDSERHQELWYRLNDAIEQRFGSSLAGDLRHAVLFPKNEEAR